MTHGSSMLATVSLVAGLGVLGAIAIAYLCKRRARARRSLELGAPWRRGRDNAKQKQRVEEAKQVQQQQQHVLNLAHKRLAIAKLGEIISDTSSTAVYKQVRISYDIMNRIMQYIQPPLGHKRLEWDPELAQ